MTFLGEWGDRSQIATVAMAAGSDYWWVTAGAVVGHGLCTAGAVIGGRAIAGKISMRNGKHITTPLIFNANLSQSRLVVLLLSSSSASSTHLKHSTLKQEAQFQHYTARMTGWKYRSRFTLKLSLSLSHVGLPM
jgi:hypothetical protein